LLAVAALPLLGGLSGEEYTDAVAVTHAYRVAMVVCAGLLFAGALLAFVLLPRRTEDRG
jgi:hypothetical protein